MISQQTILLTLAALTVAAVANAGSTRCKKEDPCNPGKTIEIAKGGKKVLDCGVTLIRLKTNSCTVKKCGYRDSCSSSKILYGSPSATLSDSCGDSFKVDFSCSLPDLRWDKNDRAVAPGDLSDGTCSGPLDVCFALDESTSVSRRNFQSQIVFVRNVVRRLVRRAPAKQAPRFSGFLFDENVVGSDVIQGELTSDYESFLRLVNDVKYDGGYTNISAGLEKCRVALDDDSRRRVVFLLTDGVQSVSADGENLKVRRYNLNSAGWNQAEEEATVIRFAKDMEDDGLAVAVMSVYPRGAKAKPETESFYRSCSSKARQPRRSAKKADSQDRSLFYSSSFEELTSAEADDMTEELCDSEVVPDPRGDVDQDRCKCSLRRVASSGACARLLEQGQGASAAQCEWMPCSQERFACDVSTEDAECRVVEDSAWVCLPGTENDNGTCDCQQRQIERVIFESWLA